MPVAVLDDGRVFDHFRVPARLRDVEARELVAPLPCYAVAGLGIAEAIGLALLGEPHPEYAVFPEDPRPRKRHFRFVSKVDAYRAGAVPRVAVGRRAGLDVVA